MPGAESDKARTIVVIEWVLFTLSVIVIGVICFAFSDAMFNSKPINSYSYSSEDITYNNYSDEDKAKVQVIFYSIIGVALLIAVAINVTLTVGVHKEHSTCCRVWYVINIIGIVLQSLSVLGNIVTLNLLGIPISIACLCYRVYAGKTIKAFMDSLSSGGSGGIVYSAPYTAAAKVNTGDQGELMYPPPPYNHNQLAQKC